jgi:hypothetical protein
MWRYRRLWRSCRSWLFLREFGFRCTTNGKQSRLPLRAAGLDDPAGIAFRQPTLLADTLDRLSAPFFGDYKFPEATSFRIFSSERERLVASRVRSPIAAKLSKLLCRAHSFTALDPKRPSQVKIDLSKSTTEAGKAAAPNRLPSSQQE